MQKTLCKLLSWVLIVAMIASVMPLAMATETDNTQASYWELTADESVNLSLSEDLYVNLNGHTLTGTIVTNGYMVYGMDSATDEYTCDNMGLFACVDAEGNAIVPESNTKIDLNGNTMRYVAIATESGYTFHRFYLGITKQSLAPSVTGVGYKAEFYGDTMVQAITDSIGYDLWLDGYSEVSRSADFQNALTLRVKNFDAENYGETTLYASVWMSLNGEMISSSEYSLTLRQMVEAINGNVSAYSAEQLQAVRDMIAANPVMENWQVSSILNPEVIRGQQILPSTSLTLELGNTEELTTLSFDYKVTSGTFNISLNPDWDNAFGYFAFNANGNVDPYDGVTIVELEDGYKRVTFDLNALTKYSGNPAKTLSFLYIRGAWTDATGYIDNVQYTVYTPTLVFDGGEFVASNNLVVEMANDQAVTNMSFDYKITSGENIVMALMSDWDNYYGYYAFNANGKVDNDNGITTEALGDGYIRVFLDFTTMNKTSGSPSSVLTMIYIRGAWTTASGSIENIRINEAALQPSRGQQIQPSTSLTIELGNTAKLETLSFDYKVTSGTFNISLNPDWDNAFGYFAFNAGGNVDPYDGVTIEDLEDGYKRVTFDLNALTKFSGSPSKALSFLYIRGNWTDATGFIDNVQFTKATSPSVFEGGTFVGGSDLTVNLDNDQAIAKMSFDYKITAGENIVLALMPDWDNYYGYYAFNANGKVDNDNGITTESLGDGYIRVFLDFAAMNKTSGNPSSVLTMIYIRGAWTTASGSIENIRINESALLPPRGQQIAPSTSLTIELGNTKELSTLSFDYKVTSGTFNISLNPDWDNAFGYFAFNANGNVDPYDGVTLETLEDGYIRVTFDLNALTKYNGNPAKTLSFLYIRGAWTDATGYIDNISFN
ncbi:MAG: hypothetical protein IKW10_03875 [Oscillospiraceae bacterium]|nr:hypothetical protein [Oscillospiraceae bacterium]